MTIKYTGKTPDDKGYYLVRVDGKHLEVALFGEGLGWLQIGNDYDAWQYTAAEYQIEVIKKLDLDALASSALEQVQDVAGLERLSDVTYAVQHNPNCPAKYLVRLVGKSGVLDYKNYGQAFSMVKHETGDILGFGKTIDEAIGNALAAAAPAKPD